MTHPNLAGRNLARLVCSLLAAGALTSAAAATVYISPGGNDACNGSTQTLAGSGACAVKSFSRAFSLMSGGDTLILLDGVYAAGTTGLIGPTAIPNGTSRSNMTTLRGLNGPEFVRYAGKWILGSDSTKARFIRIEGILISTGDDVESGMSINNTDFIYIKNCGIRDFGNNFRAVLGVGSNDHNQGSTNTLIEDSWIWGKNKQAFMAFCSERVVLRRVFVRHDGCNGGSFCTGSGQSSYAVGDYSSSRVSFQNVMNIDRILGGSGEFGAFAGINQGGPCYNDTSRDTHHIEHYGTVAFNAQDQGWGIDLSTNDFSKPTYTTKNSVSWKIADGEAFGGHCTNCPSADWTMSNTTGGLSQRYNYAEFTMDVKTDSSLAYMTTGSDDNFNFRPVDSLAYDDGFGSGCTGNCLTSNPTVAQPGFANPCLKYPMRVESGSACSGAGVGGKDIGANVVGYGTDGTFYGDPGYDTERDFAAVWPFPNEQLIKKQVCADDVQGRGWCADFVNAQNPGKTLTQYLWEDLGHPCPPEICQGTGGDPGTPPPAPSNVQRNDAH